MTQLLRNWISLKLGVYLPHHYGDSEEFRHDMSNGFIIAEILRKYCIISDDQMVSIKHSFSRKSKRRNMEHLFKWSSDFGLPFHHDDFREISEEKPGAIFNFLYKLYYILEGKAYRPSNVVQQLQSDASMQPQPIDSVFSNVGPPQPHEIFEAKAEVSQPGVNLQCAIQQIKHPRHQHMRVVKPQNHSLTEEEDTLNDILEEKEITLAEPLDVEPMMAVTLGRNYKHFVNYRPCSPKPPTPTPRPLSAVPAVEKKPGKDDMHQIPILSKGEAEEYEIDEEKQRRLMSPQSEFDKTLEDCFQQGSMVKNCNIPVGKTMFQTGRVYFAEKSRNHAQQRLEKQQELSYQFVKNEEDYLDEDYLKDEGGKRKPVGVVSSPLTPEEVERKKKRLKEDYENSLIKDINRFDDILLRYSEEEGLAGRETIDGSDVEVILPNPDAVKFRITRMKLLRQQERDLTAERNATRKHISAKLQDDVKVKIMADLEDCAMSKVATLPTKEAELAEFLLQSRRERETFCHHMIFESMALQDIEVNNVERNYLERERELDLKEFANSVLENVEEKASKMEEKDAAKGVEKSMREILMPFVELAIRIGNYRMCADDDPPPDLSEAWNYCLTTEFKSPEAFEGSIQEAMVVQEYLLQDPECLNKFPLVSVVNERELMENARLEYEHKQEFCTWWFMKEMVYVMMEVAMKVSSFKESTDFHPPDNFIEDWRKDFFMDNDEFGYHSHLDSPHRKNRLQSEGDVEDNFSKTMNKFVEGIIEVAMNIGDYSSVNDVPPPEETVEDWKSILVDRKKVNTETDDATIRSLRRGTSVPRISIFQSFFSRHKISAPYFEALDEQESMLEEIHEVADNEEHPKEDDTIASESKLNKKKTKGKKHTQIKKGGKKKIKGTVSAAAVSVGHESDVDVGDDVVADSDTKSVSSEAKRSAGSGLRKRAKSIRFTKSGHEIKIFDSNDDNNSQGN